MVRYVWLLIVLLVLLANVVARFKSWYDSTSSCSEFGVAVNVVYGID